MIPIFRKKSLYNNAPALHINRFLCSIETSNNLQEETELESIKLNCLEVLARKINTENKNITKSDLENGITSVSVTVTENTDGTFTVLSNTTGNKYIVTAQGEVSKEN